jgi:hypothetical protein
MAMTVPTHPASDPARLGAVVRYLDVIIVLVATVPVLALGAPVFGYLCGAGAWLLQRALQIADRRFTSRVSDSVRRAGVTLFEAFGRIWLLAGAIVIAGVAGGRADGLTAAITIFAAYSIAFAIRILSGPPPRSQS